MTTNGQEYTDFGWALRQLRDGKKVCRKDWIAPVMWLVLVRSEDWNNDVPYEIGGALGENCSPWIGMRTAWGGFVPWHAGQDDMLAEDWEVVGL